MKYTEAFDIAKTVILYRSTLGFRYLDGVARKAALAAARCTSYDSARDALVAVLEAGEVPSTWADPVV